MELMQDTRLPNLKTKPIHEVRLGQIKAALEARRDALRTEVKAQLAGSGDERVVETDCAELEFLTSQRLARIATASSSGVPDVAAVGFGVDGDDIVTGGYDITKTVRYRNLLLKVLSLRGRRINKLQVELAEGGE